MKKKQDKHDDEKVNAPKISPNKSGAWIYPKLVSLLDSAIRGVKQLDDDTLTLFAQNINRLSDEEKQHLNSTYGQYLEMQLNAISIFVETDDLVSSEMVREVLYGKDRQRNANNTGNSNERNENIIIIESSSTQSSQVCKKMLIYIINQTNQI